MWILKVKCQPSRQAGDQSPSWRVSLNQHIFNSGPETRRVVRDLIYSCSMEEILKLLICIDRWWQFCLFILPALETIPTCDLLLRVVPFSKSKQLPWIKIFFGVHSWFLLFEVILEGNSLQLYVFVCVRADDFLWSLYVFLAGASRGAEWGMRGCRSHGGTRRSMTWRRWVIPHAAVHDVRRRDGRLQGGRRLKSKRLTAPTGHGISHLCLLSSSPLGRDPLCFKCGIFWPDERCGLMTEACVHSSQTLPTSPVLQKFLHHLGSWNQPVGCFPESPQPKSTLGSIILSPLPVSLLHEVSFCSPCKSSKLSLTRNNCLS